MKLKIAVHRKAQWDFEDFGYTTIAAAHVNSPNKSARVFFLGKHIKTGLYGIEFNPREVCERLRAAFEDAYGAL